MLILLSPRGQNGCHYIMMFLLSDVMKGTATASSNKESKIWSKRMECVRTKPVLKMIDSQKKVLIKCIGREPRE